MLRKPQGTDHSDPASHTKKLPLLIILILLEPSHLNRFQLAFRRPLRIILEIRQLRDPLMQVRETNVRRIQIRMSLKKTQRNIFNVIPSKARHGFRRSDLYAQFYPGPQMPVTLLLCIMTTAIALDKIGQS
jgi:hypothetical protein